MPEIQLPTAAKQNQILETIKDTGVNFYENLLSADFVENTTDNYSTVLEVNGAGNLLELSLTSTNTTNPIKLKITADEKVVLETSRTSFSKKTATIALVLKDAILFNMPATYSTTTLYIMSLISNSNVVSNLGDNTGSSLYDVALKLLKTPISFNDSLKIEASNYQKKGSGAFFRGSIIYQLK